MLRDKALPISEHTVDYSSVGMLECWRVRSPKWVKNRHIFRKVPTTDLGRLDLERPIFPLDCHSPRAAFKVLQEKLLQALSGPLSEGQNEETTPCYHFNYKYPQDADTCTFENIYAAS